MRLFLALDLPDALRQALAALHADLLEARWVPPENLHVTLHFLGEATAERAEALAADVRDLNFEALPLNPVGLDAFPNLRRPRVLVVRLASHPALAALHERTAALIVQHGFMPEARPFQPHITLARFKHAPREAITAYLRRHPVPPPAVAQRIGLYQSLLTPAGARYEVLGRSG